MHYHEAAAFLFDLRRFSVKPGTERVEALLAHLGDPQEDVPFVQIAGSNGKGSAARLTESVLREAGLSVGLYTSPHLSALTERVRVDGREMTEAAVADFVAEVRPWLIDRAAAGEPLTFFEVVTAMAVREFARRDVDVAVLEVGLGGEYDATSAVDPVATAVTNVSLEHTAVLGDTIGEIARTKARIARPDAPFVTACEGEALDVVREVAGEAGAPVTRVTGDGGSSVSGPSDSDPSDPPALAASYGGRVSATDAEISVVGEREGTYRIPLVGRHQAANVAVAVALADRTAAALTDGAAAAPDDALPDRAARDGLARATWPGRFEVVDTAPLTVLDGAHNPAAARTLAATLDEYEYDDLHLVYGAMHDKDHAETAAALPDAATAVTCRPAIDRAEDPDVLAAALRSAGVDRVTAGGDVADALAGAVDRAAPGDCVLLVGSLFAVAEARAARMRTVRERAVRGADDAAHALDTAGVPPETAEAHRDGVDHRVLTLRLRGDRAERVASEARSAGGDAALGGLDASEDRGAGGEQVPVTIAGTVAELRALVDRLAAADGGGLGGVAADLAAAAGIESDELDGADGGGESAPEFPWTGRTAVMGVLNVTPDSFHDGGRHADLDDAVAGVERMVEAGVDIVDVGGESTRPGAEPVPVDEEIERVVPTIEAIQSVPAVGERGADGGDVLVSVDTRKPAVAEAALDAGADIINDVTGLEDPEMRSVVADADCPVIVMHSLDAPVDPDADAEYDDVVGEVVDALRERLALADTAGIDRDRVIVDPGLGFGKSPAEDFELLARCGELSALGCPVLVGHSHKSLYGAVGRDADDREHATVAGTALAADRGADIVRVHDVAENRAAVDVAAAVNGSLRDGASRGGEDGE